MVIQEIFQVVCHSNEIPHVDHTLDNNSRIGSLTDDVIINNSSIAHSLMTFAEIYLAYKFAASKKCNIIFLNGRLSSTYRGLIAATSASKLWKTNCSLLRIDVDGIQLDLNDLRIARNSIVNEVFRFATTITVIIMESKLYL